MTHTTDPGLGLAGDLAQVSRGGPIGPPAPSARPGPVPAPQVWSLARGLAAFGGPLLWEPSLKLCAGCLIADRFMLSMPPPAPGAPWRGLKRFLRGLGMPERLLAITGLHLRDAALLHLGYERAPAGTTWKLYLEFPGVSAGAPGAPPRLVHLGLKWDPAHPASGRVARYLDRSAATLPALAARITAICTDADPLLRALAADLIERAAPAIGPAAIQLFEVREEGSARHSFDLGFYDARLPVAAIADRLDGLCDRFAIGAPERERLHGCTAGATLGHFAAGLARDGAAFCTLFYGAGRLGLEPPAP